MTETRDLIETFPRQGQVEWIGVASARLADIESRDAVTVVPGTGIDGEHHAQSGNSQRQVTLIQQEHLPVIAGLLQRDSVAPEQLRRNILVSGINLLALKLGRFRIGDVLLEGTGPCAPCSRMELNLGEGGYNAMRGHGGITAVVIEGGEIRVGDPVSAVAGFLPKDD